MQALESEPVQTAFKKQMIKAVPNSSMDDAQAFNRAEMAYWKKVTDQVKVELQSTMARRLLSPSAWKIWSSPEYLGTYLSMRGLVALSRS